MNRICIWMNHPSHHQSAFFAALYGRADVDLRVVYFSETSPTRIMEGWKAEYDCQPFESCLDPACTTPEQMLEPLADWQERIHLISSYFSPSLITYFCEHQVAWCHWSEVPGYRLAGLLNYRMMMFHLFYPLMLICKREKGRFIGKHALGVFAQGTLARRAFRFMGIPNRCIADLYYVPAALTPMNPMEQVVQFANGRKVFLSAAALCRRKGIDVLLKSFARLKVEEWCLVLCGIDRSKGFYHALCRKLGIEGRVLFLGVHPSERIAEVYASAHVFVLSSRFDGWGAVLNEATSLGLPLIATDHCGGAWHLIEPGVNGYRVRAGSVNALADSMKVYVEHSHLALQHGEASIRRFNDLFTPERNASRLVDALQAWGHK